MYGDIGDHDEPGFGTDPRAAGPGAGDRNGPGNGTGSRNGAGHAAGTGHRDMARMRVSDADRDRAAAELSVHFQAGRLTQDEFDERVGQAINARTQGDLDELLADLPSQRPAGPLPVAEPPSPVARDTRWLAPAAVLTTAALLFVVAAASPHWHERWAPWWLIPLAFIAIRRLAWRGGGPGGRRWP